MLVQIKVTLGSGSDSIAAQVPIPMMPVSPDGLLPAMQKLTNTVVTHAVEIAEQHGRRISCGPGCDACCHQVVPISPIEARSLLHRITSMPEPQQSLIRQRFADAAKRIEQADLRTRVEAILQGGDESTVAIARDYFAMRIPCPFLENGCCSIYEDRPLTCREHLAVSPAENCTTADFVDLVDVPFVISAAARRLENEDEQDRPQWLPLALLLDWEVPPENGRKRQGIEILQELLQRLQTTD